MKKEAIYGEEFLKAYKENGGKFRSRYIIKKAPLIEKWAPLKDTVLLLGPSGIGKEVLAKTIHFLSKREGKFVPVNCGGLDENLLQSELFGHKKGSYTGAVSDRPGVIKQAQRGTLFLDEIGDISLWSQIVLLRFLNDGKYRPLGDSNESQADVRVICATNQDLGKKIREGKLREDFFYRISVFSLNLPPVAPLDDNRLKVALNTLIPETKKELGQQGLSVDISQEAKKMLREYHYPGNYRELRNIIKYTLVNSDGRSIYLKDIQDWIRRTTPGDSGSDLQYLPPDNFLIAVNRLIFNKFNSVLIEKGNFSGASKEFGMTLTRFQRLLSKSKEGKII